MIINEAKEILSLERNKETTLMPLIQNLESDIQAFMDKGDFSNPEYISKSKELSKKNEQLNLIKSISHLIQQHQESTDLLNDESMKELAQEDLENITSELESKISQLRELSSIELKYDSNKAIFEIRPGVGGTEAALFAETLFQMYIKFCSSEGIRVEQYSIDYETEGGIKEAVFLADGDDTFKLFRFEAGVHRVQRVPSTESAGRIHTSTASVVVLPEIEAQDVQIKDEDLRIDIYRSSGPGGQSVNTTDSAVRVTHLPTGITVACQNGKSQHKNKEMAMSILASKLAEIEDEKRQSSEQDIRQSAIAGGDRSAKIRTYNFPQGRITDHRVHKSWFNIDEVVNGNPGEIIKEVARELRAEIEAKMAA